MSKKEIKAWNDQTVKTVNETPKYYGEDLYLLMLYCKYSNHELDGCEDLAEYVRKTT